MRMEGKKVKANVFFSQPEFFRIFSLPLKKGDPGKALSHAHSLVLTEETAQKYFGNSNPMGQVITFDHQYDLVVTGVLQSIPENSSIKFDMLASHALRDRIDPDFSRRWWETGTYTYVRCSADFSVADLEKALVRIQKRHIPDFMKDRIRLAIQPLARIHLDARTTGEMVPGNAPIYLHILAAVALSVLMIACFNFTNLSLARYRERTKEIGVRKVLGAQRQQLVKQFLGEAVFMSVLASGLGMVLAEVALPTFNNLVNRELAFEYQDNVLLLMSVFGCGLLVGILAGSYPAFFLSGYQPVQAIRAQKPSSRGNTSLRRVLIVAQFAISSLLIVCELVVLQQLEYMKAKDLGFDPNQVLAIPTGTFDMAEEQFPRLGAYMQAIQRGKDRAGIESCTVSENIPGRHFHNKFGVIPESLDREASLEMIVTSIDENFLDTYKLPVVEGRNLSLEFSTDRSQAVLLNETAVDKIGWVSAVGKQIEYIHGGEPLHIVGVVADIHFQPLQQAIEPLVFRYADDQYESRYISVRIRSGYTQAALRFLEETWQEHILDRPFEYTFVVEDFEANYRPEKHTARLIGSFSFFCDLPSLFRVVRVGCIKRLPEDKGNWYTQGVGRSRT